MWCQFAIGDARSSPGRSRPLPPAVLLLAIEGRCSSPTAPNSPTTSAAAAPRVVTADGHLVAGTGARLAGVIIQYSTLKLVLAPKSKSLCAGMSIPALEGALKLCAPATTPLAL